jgi:hypothetical protein
MGAPARVAAAANRGRFALRSDAGFFVLDNKAPVRLQSKLKHGGFSQTRLVSINTTEAQNMKIRNAFAFVLALGVLTSATQRAQAIVGYVNVTMSAGYNLIVNPLDNAINTLNPVMTNVPDGCLTFLWNTTNQSFTAPSIFQLGFGWDLNYDISPGKGFMVWSPVAWTNTFVGTVLQGTLTNFVAGTNKLSLLGDKAPLSGPLGSTHLFPAIDNASAYTFSAVSQSYLDACNYFTGFGWFDPRGVADTNGPSISVGQGFFVQNPGPSTNWVKTFIAQVVEPNGPEIRGLTIVNNSIVLSINNEDRSYGVQFSTDRISWQTISNYQHSNVWTSPYPAGQQGFYRAIYQ